MPGIEQPCGEQTEGFGRDPLPAICLIKQPVGDFDVGEIPVQLLPADDPHHPLASINDREDAFLSGPEPGLCVGSLELGEGSPG